MQHSKVAQYSRNPSTTKRHVMRDDFAPNHAPKFSDSPHSTSSTIDLIPIALLSKATDAAPTPSTPPHNRRDTVEPYRFQHETAHHPHPSRRAREGTRKSSSPLPTFSSSLCTDSIRIPRATENVSADRTWQKNAWPYALVHPTRPNPIPVDHAATPLTQTNPGVGVSRSRETQDLTLCRLVSVSHNS